METVPRGGLAGTAMWTRDPLHVPLAPHSASPCLSFPTCELRKAPLVIATVSITTGASVTPSTEWTTRQATSRPWQSKAREPRAQVHLAETGSQSDPWGLLPSVPLGTGLFRSFYPHQPAPLQDLPPSPLPPPSTQGPRPSATLPCPLPHLLYCSRVEVIPGCLEPGPSDDAHLPTHAWSPGQGPSVLGWHRKSSRRPTVRPLWWNGARPSVLR